MSLDLSCIEYVGRHLYVTPEWGWGWAGTDFLPTEHMRNGVPIPFHIKVLQFLSQRNDVRGGVISGGIGVIEESKHLLDGSWIIFRTRGHKGNFSTKLIKYDIIIGMADKELRGYGIIAETLKQIQYWRENRLQLQPCPNIFVDEELRAEMTKLLEEFQEA